MAISTGAALLGGALIGGATSLIGGSEAASGAKSAARTQAEAQMAQLQYLKEREAVPQQYREQAIKQLGALYGMSPYGSQTGQPAMYTKEAILAGGVPGYKARVVMPDGSSYTLGNEDQQDVIQQEGLTGFQGALAAGQQFPYHVAASWGIGEDPEVGGIVPTGTTSYVDPVTGQKTSVPTGGAPGSIAGAIPEGGVIEIIGPDGQVISPDDIPEEGLRAPDTPGLAPVLSKEEFVSGLSQDPFYEQLVSTGEEAVLRGAAATGGLRSGTASEALAAQNQAILRGLYQEQVSGLQGLAGLPTMAPQIADVIGQVGATKAAGQVAAGQAKQGMYQNLSDVMMGSLGMGLKYGVI